MRPGDARPWVSKAEGDWRACRKLSPRTEPDGVCFHAQQCAEKYLKAVLVRDRVAFPKTHDLRMLLGIALGRRPQLLALGPDLDTLNPLSVLIRYPGQEASPTDAREAAAAAGRVRRVLRRFLAPRRRRRRKP